MTSIADYYESLRYPRGSEMRQTLDHSYRGSAAFADRMMAARRNAELREISRQVEEESWATIERIYGYARSHE